MIKIKLLLAFNYKYEFFIGLISKIILLFASAFFWKAAYNGLDTISMVDERQMLIYTVISIIMNGVFSVTIEGNIRSRVRMGNVAVDFIKPVNIFAMYFSEDVGLMVTSIIQSAVPVFICSLLFIVAPFPSSALNLLLFLISSAVSFMILWLISAVFGLLYFWFIDLGPLGGIKNYLIQILSGSFIPIWFFPKGLQTFLKYLPFTYIYQHPIGIYIGRTPLNEAVSGIVIQVIWAAAFLLLFDRMRKNIEGNILVQGG